MEIENSTYNIWLESIKVKIRSAQLKASVAVNSELLEVYWELGKEIVQKQNEAQWGDAILDQLSVDLRLSFPNIKGFSKRNLYSIRQWHLFYNQQFTFVPQVVAQLPWGQQFTTFALKIFCIFHKASYICINSTRFASRQISLRVFLFYSFSAQNATLLLRKAHFNKFLFNLLSV